MDLVNKDMATTSQNGLWFPNSVDKNISSPLVTVFKSQAALYLVILCLFMVIWHILCSFCIASQSVSVSLWWFCTSYRYPTFFVPLWTFCTLSGDILCSSLFLFCNSFWSLFLFVGNFESHFVLQITSDCVPLSFCIWPVHLFSNLSISSAKTLMGISTLT